MVTPIDAVSDRSRSPKLNGDFSALRICSAVSCARINRVHALRGTAVWDWRSWRPSPKRMTAPSWWNPSPAERYSPFGYQVRQHVRANNSTFHRFIKYSYLFVSDKNFFPRFRIPNNVDDVIRNERNRKCSRPFFRQRRSRRRSAPGLLRPRRWPRPPTAPRPSSSPRSAAVPAAPAANVDHVPPWRDG